MYRWLAKILFVGWLGASAYSGVANKVDWHPLSPAVPQASEQQVSREVLPDLPDARQMAQGAEKLAREAKEQARSKEFGFLVGDLAALVLYAWDKAAGAMTASFAPCAKPQAVPGQRVDEVTIAQAVDRMRTAVADAADVAVEASQVVARRHPETPPDTVLPQVPQAEEQPSQVPAKALVVPSERGGMILREYPAPGSAPNQQDVSSGR